ncbi:MAG: PspC domain-containing protein [Deltaproteobacteria bacterium]|nr:PspC domain-containing protein [Deltaproteobacteria bacterium]
MKRWILLMVCAACLGAPTALCAADGGKDEKTDPPSDVKSIVLKAMIVNPSESKPQKIPIELPLPREATKRTVLDLAEGLKIVYDSEQGLYKAMGDLILKPAEQRMVRIRLEDIWQIPESELQFQKGYLPSLLKALAGTKYEETANQLAGTIENRLDQIETTQAQSHSPSKHIAMYRENLSVMNEVKKDIKYLEKLAAEKAPMAKELFETAGDEGRGVPSETMATITLKMRVQNPSQTEKAILPVEYYLPREVQERDVVSAAGLAVRYDLTRGTVFLYKADVELGPGETKTYEVVLRDIWRVEPEKVQLLEIKAAGFAQGLEGTIFQQSAVKLAKEIDNLAKQIIENQGKVERQPLEERIAVFVENLGLVAEMKEKMTTMARIDAVQTISPETKPESLGLATPTEQDPASSETSEKSSQRGPKILSKTIFEGKAPDATTVWRMIFAIIIFLGFVSLIFYIIWWRQVLRPSTITPASG